MPMTTITTSTLEGSAYARLVIPWGGTETGAEEKDYSFHQVLGPGELGESGIMAQLTCRKRPLVLDTLERHVDSPEVLAALDGDVVVCLAAPELDPAACRPGDIQAYLLKQGHALWMDKRTWHWLPFPTDKSRVSLLLIFREATGERDIEFRKLPQPIGVERS
jgi:ureidoglycolate hydrolase